MYISFICGKFSFDITLGKRNYAGGSGQGGVHWVGCYSSCRRVGQCLFLILQKGWFTQYLFLNMSNIALWKNLSSFLTSILLHHVSMWSGTLCLLAFSSPLRQHWLMTTANVQLDRSRLCLILTFSLYSYVYIDALAFWAPRLIQY